MMTRITTAALVAVTTAGIALAGCGGSECEKIYAKLKKCDKDFEKVPKDEFVKRCEEAKKKTPEEFKEQTACIGKSTCEEYTACEEAAQTKRQVDRLMKKLAEAKQSKNYDDAVSDCRFDKELLDANADAKKACDEILGLALVEMTKTVETKRDAGERAFRECLDLKEIAGMLGGDHVAKTETLCAEADAGERAGEALKEAKANIDAKKADLPTSCGMAMSDLEKVDSEWGKAKTAEVAKACFLDLGKVIMEAKVPGMKYVCDYTVGEVYKAVQKYELKDPEMDAHMAKAAKLCEKKADK